MICKMWLQVGQCMSLNWKRERERERKTIVIVYSKVGVYNPKTIINVNQSHNTQNAHGCKQNVYPNNSHIYRETNVPAEQF